MTATKDFCAKCGWNRPTEDTITGRDKLNRPIVRRVCAECIKADRSALDAISSLFAPEATGAPAVPKDDSPEPTFTAIYVFRAQWRAFWYGVLVGVLLSVAAVVLALVPR